MQTARTNPVPRAAGRPAAQAGVGLIEVLIAVAVLSIGFLGIAALQMRALANNESAMMRTQATVVSYSILDAMRADRGSAMVGNYNTTATYDVNSDTKCSYSSSPSSTLAQNQVEEWCTGSGATPPVGLASLGVDSATGEGASGEINCDNAGVCTITITFDDRRGSGGSDAQKLVTKAML